MYKKLLVLSLMSVIVNVFALYVNGEMLITGETVLNEDLIIGPLSLQHNGLYSYC
ncbi:MAG: hypothetical protein KKD38_00205 [Candidatus Delongbacteria bacterium]|nr:hypothetical protein [Candidatus Delongbacteria bacterium]MCG2761334.1 hypothetical protein [Candidatus Delongbacteria bacterium]